MQTRVYHIVHETNFKSVNIHIWTECNLRCQGCYCKFEKLDFGLIDDFMPRMATKALESPPTRFLSIDEVIELLKGLDINRTILIGTEPSLDPGLPALAKALHDELGTYNIMLTNGVKLTDMEHIDEVVFSIKAYSEDIYRDYTGKSNKKTLENFVTVYRSGERLQAECLLIPDYIEAEEIERVAKFIASVDRNITLRIDGYFPVNGCPWRAATAQDIEEAVKLARKHLNKVNCLTSSLERVGGEKAVRIL